MRVTWNYKDKKIHGEVIGILSTDNDDLRHYEGSFLVRQDGFGLYLQVIHPSKLEAEGNTDESDGKATKA